ncbi:hypothetical protein [Acidisphaera rubrifaciens]|uniref:Anti-sigma factor NepR domain-containing protein n=1 Tax=Acidisphaera rubrifaciens HS-AP3 TaxID=1231350 RepID=A0A0D6P348_9PROT|nr:hypothetical protein [Acidisphaera rubrifaciens]GAN76175.1 hypothetical protein Asru_0067_13 [Acidisphaera rubrifaciens HS-AP3]
MGYADHHVRPKASESGERDAFDRWLRRSLRQAHDDIIAEPVPDALMQILGEAAPQAASANPAADGAGPADRTTPPPGSSGRGSSGPEA